MNKLEKLLNIVDYDILMDMVQQVNGWDGSLDYLEYIETDLFDEYFYDELPGNIADMIYYGDYNPKAAYFKVNAYGNIISYNTYEVLEDLGKHEKDIVERFIELYKQGHIDSSYKEILNILNNN